MEKALVKDDQPRLIDFDDGEIEIRLDGKILRGWSYKDDDERRIKMLAAREYVEGWYDGRALAMTTIERLWNPFQTCSTEDNRPVELKFPGGDVHLGYFSSSQSRWVHAEGKPFPEGLYPSHWRCAR